jgi:hypothetical protein
MNATAQLCQSNYWHECSRRRTQSVVTRPRRDFRQANPLLLFNWGINDVFYSTASQMSLRWMLATVRKKTRGGFVHGVAVQFAGRLHEFRYCAQKRDAPPGGLTKGLETLQQPTPNLGE